jgi:hypothetical protein
MKFTTYIFIVLFTIIGYNASSQHNSSAYRYYDDSLGKYGFKNYYDQIIIEAIYDYCTGINEENYRKHGLIRVVLNRKNNFMNLQEKYISPIFFADCGDFHEGLAMIKIDSGTYGYINPLGEVTIPPIYYDTYRFSDGFASVMLKNSKWKYIDNKGESISDSIYDIAHEFSDGFAKVGIINGKKKYWGYIDQNGFPVVPIRYDWVNPPSQTDSISLVFQGKVRDYKWGGGHSYDGKWGIVRNGVEIISVKYDDEIYFKGDLALVKKGEKYGIYNKKGKLIIDIKYDYISYARGRAIVKNGKKWGIINLLGQFIVPFKQFDYIDDFNIVNQNTDYARVYIGKTDFEGYPIEGKGKWGYINNFGKIMIPLIYDSVGIFKEGKAKVQKGNEEFYIDSNGLRVN